MIRTTNMAESFSPMTVELDINNQKPATPLTVATKPVVLNGQLVADPIIVNPGVLQ